MTCHFKHILLVPVLTLMGCTGSGIGGSGGDYPPERATIRGVMSVDEDGKPRLEDCDTRRPVTLAGLTEGHRLYLLRRHGELSRRHAEPVTAEVSGYLERNKKGLHLERAAPLWVASGACVDEGDGYLDYN